MTESPAELDALYHDLFKVDRRGQAILADLAQRFARAPAKGFDAAAVNETFARAHQRAVIDYIALRMARAEGDQDIGAVEE